jgi:hypothetical protein
MTDGGHIDIIDGKIAIRCPQYGCAGITRNDTGQQACVACDVVLTDEILARREEWKAHDSSLTEAHRSSPARS